MENANVKILPIDELRRRLKRSHEIMETKLENHKATIQMCKRLNSEMDPSSYALSGDIEYVKKQHERELRQLEDALHAAQTANDYEHAAMRDDSEICIDEHRGSRAVSKSTRDGRIIVASGESTGSPPSDDDKDEESSPCSSPASLHTLGGNKDSQRARSPTEQGRDLSQDNSSKKPAAPQERAAAAAGGVKHPHGRQTVDNVGVVDNVDDVDVGDDDVNRNFVVFRQGVAYDNDDISINVSSSITHLSSPEKMRIVEKHQSSEGRRDHDYSPCCRTQEKTKTACLSSNDHESEDNDEDEPEDDHEDESEDEEQEEEQEEEVKQLKSRSLYIAIQGLRQKRINYNQNEEDGRDIKDGSVPPEGETLEVFTYGKHEFRKGLCYGYRDRSIKRSKVLVGIIRFLPTKNEALCVLIAPFKDTFLGVEDEDTFYKARKPPAPFVQVGLEEYCLSLRNFTNEECRVPDRIPDLIYEPQREGQWRQMGYFYKNTPVRHGIRQSIRLLDLFAGCGGMSQGFDRVGYTTVKVVENNPIAIETYSTNMLNHPIYPGDVTEFLRRCESNDDYRKLHGRIDHLHASPPCQGYSGANRLGGTNDQANINLTSSFLDAVRIFRPVTATFENVVGMWKRKHQHHLKNILAGLLDLGYQVRLSELIACDYGDPQARPRLFIFCARNFAVLPSLPTKIYGALPLIPVVTVKDVLERYLHLSDKERNSLPNMKGSKTTLKAGQHGVVQLDADRPCATLRASSTPPLHYSQDRCITVREAASLQSFPPTFVICGSIREQYRQIGNAVPVKLATAVARCVRDALEYEFVQESE